MKKWETALDSFVGHRVEVSELEVGFPGVCEDGGTFRTHLELAALAISLKHRVVLLQGVEAGQSDPDNPFASFVRSLKDDQQRILELEARIDNVLLRLSALEVRSPKRLIDKVMTRKQVDTLLETSYRLRALGVEVGALAPNQEVSSISRSTATERSWCSQPARPDLLPILPSGGTSRRTRSGCIATPTLASTDELAAASDASQTTSALNSYATSWT